MFKTERKILQRLLNTLWELDILEVELSMEERLQGIYKIPNPSNMRLIRTRKENKEKEYSELLKGLKTIKQGQ